MNELAVVYWSGTGNTEMMAKAVAEGAKSAGAEVKIYEAKDFTPELAQRCLKIAFGCPAMGEELLEEDEFEPMFAAVEHLLKRKSIALFGSYDWGNGEWMRSWQKRSVSDGAAVVTTVIASLTPDEEAQAACKELGSKLAKA